MAMGRHRKLLTNTHYYYAQCEVLNLTIGMYQLEEKVAASEKNCTEGKCW